MRSAEALTGLIDFLPSADDQRWLDVACGPGLVARALAPRVRSVDGVDLTPAMVDLATSESGREGIANVRFKVGDVTALTWPDGEFDGAVTRFSLHHIPLPERCVEEMARVVRGGGFVAIGDHLGARDRADGDWHETIERLRDPSHWACLPLATVQGMAERAGLTREGEKVVPFALEFDEWLNRGSGGPAARPLIERALRDRPNGVESFRVEVDGAGRAMLHLMYGITLWRKPVLTVAGG